jgi:ABC-type cobalt transport system substrate-binding protein
MTTFSSMLSANWEIDSEAQAKAAAKQVTPPYNPFMARTIFSPYSWLMESTP